MAIALPGRLVEFLLLGPLEDRRQLQDSPILGDVWVKYGEEPARAHDLLITPYRHENAARLAVALEEDLYRERRRRREGEEAEVAYLQGLVVARLTFAELVRYVVPRSAWWASQVRRGRGGGRPAAEAAAASPPPTSHHALVDLLVDEAAMVEALEGAVRTARLWFAEPPRSDRLQGPSTTRFATLAALIAWAAAEVDDAAGANVASGGRSVEQRVAELLDRLDPSTAVRRLFDMLAGAVDAPRDEGGELQPLVYLVSLDRVAVPAVARSVPAVKADAAHRLFEVDCSNLAWAVLDSGIDGRHPAFLDAEEKSRIVASYDFRNFRKIVSIDNRRKGTRERNVKTVLDSLEPGERPPEEDARKDFRRLADDAVREAPVHWELVERYIRIEPTKQPLSPHGTHVAGILGGRGGAGSEERHGMCPDIRLYDFRILSSDLEDTEFAIIAALQFIRYLNERGSLKAIHGVNLSLSIPHDVRNYACGRTPICNECERLVDSGVVVVAAAGNHGYKNFQTLEGSYAGYAAFSITDPGNADSVITVGATHRFWPHTYGVSFFSSRGPTGDGRVKPDLVAPGERIHAPYEVVEGHGGTWDDLDGTSMAAPHVSGAAAMLMSRYTELIAQPRRIKQILCESATDLGRERTFQGHGMLDVLRAFQSL